MRRAGPFQLCQKAPEDHNSSSSLNHSLNNNARELGKHQHDTPERLSYRLLGQDEFLRQELLHKLGPDPHKIAAVEQAKKASILSPPIPVHQKVFIKQTRKAP